MNFLLIGINKHKMFIADYSQSHNGAYEFTFRFKPNYCYYDGKFIINIQEAQLQPTDITEGSWHHVKVGSPADILSIDIGLDGQVWVTSEYSISKSATNEVYRRPIINLKQLTDDWVFISANNVLSMTTLNIFETYPQNSIQENLALISNNQRDMTHIYSLWEINLMSLLQSIEIANDDRIEEAAKLWTHTVVNNDIKIVPISIDSLRPLEVGAMNWWGMEVEIPKPLPEVKEKAKSK